MSRTIEEGYYHSFLGIGHLSACCFRLIPGAIGLFGRHCYVGCNVTSGGGSFILA